jgi:hypothetical protein
MLNDGYQDQSQLRPGHRTNAKADAARVVWQQASALVDYEYSDQPQHVKEWAKGMRERLENLAKELEAGSGLFKGDDTPICLCGRGRVVFHGLCPDCLETEDREASLEARGNQREARGG